MYVCVWSPGWSIDAASGAEVEGGAEAGPGEARSPLRPAAAGPLLAELAPRVRVEREQVWADGRGLDAAVLARRLVARLAGEGTPARAGVATLPITAELAARWGGWGEAREADIPFLVKERTGWGWRTGAAGAAYGKAVATPARPFRDPAPSTPPAGEEGGEAGRVVVVERGRERAWAAGLPVAALGPGERLRTLLEGVGVDTVGTLGGLEREAVEVRFGPEAVALWRLARGDDRRLLFEPVVGERPHGSIDFVDYVLTDPSRLLFTANALLGPLCEGLTGRGEHARALRLTLPLANGEVWERVIRPSRPTASRTVWLRLVRELFDRLTVPDAVAGMRMEVGSTEEAAVRQGDLFDRGFATAAAVEAAVARLADRQLHPLAPRVDAHPLMERRGRWRLSGESVSAEPDGAGNGSGEVEPAPFRDGSPGAASRDAAPRAKDGREVGLSLQLLPRPRRLAVETQRRRDHEVPVRLRDRREWRPVLLAAGPDRISGGQWESSSYAREYYRCVMEDGAPLWIYRDGLDGSWYLHGWWD